MSKSSSHHFIFYFLYPLHEVIHDSEAEFKIHFCPGYMGDKLGYKPMLIWCMASAVLTIMGFTFLPKYKATPRFKVQSSCVSCSLAKKFLLFWVDLIQFIVEYKHLIDMEIKPILLLEVLFDKPWKNKSV